MKYLAAVLFSVFFGTITYGQVISYDDFTEVIPFLQKEDFKDAFEKTNKLLGSTQNDSSDLRAIVTYMNIYSAAAMVSLDQMTYADFKHNTQRYVGQRLVMSAHPCVDSSVQAFNSLKFVTQDGVLQGMTISSNSKNTSIFCFEYFKFSETINPADFIGKTVRTGGILESIEVNPHESRIWVARLHVANAIARVMEPR